MEQDPCEPKVDQKGESRRVEMITGIGLSPDKLDPVIHPIDARTGARAPLP